MDYNLDELNIPDVTEIAFVVNDLQEGVARFSAIYSLDQWQLYRFEPPALSKMTLHGEPQEHSYNIGLASTDNIFIELIEPTGGDSLFHEHLREQGEGIHHIAYYPYDDPVAVKNHFENAGMPVIQSGTYDDTEFWFFDSQDELGIIFETASGVDDFPTPDAVYIDRSDEWPL